MLLRMVEAQSAGVSTTALAQSAGLHENTVRGHLEHLLEDGYLTREREPAAGRGRPAWLWHPVTRDPESPYAALASVLAGTLARTSVDPVADAREAGRGWGREIGAGLDREVDAGSARRAVVSVMRDQGFAPDDTGGAIVLRRCPLIQAAARHTDVVCAVHLGMIDGVLHAIGRDDRVGLVPFTGPSQCTLLMRAANTQPS
ncbi:helix-turn-helix domain-containing protein [Microbacterium invictum]